MPSSKGQSFGPPSATLASFLCLYHFVILPVLHPSLGLFFLIYKLPYLLNWVSSKAPIPNVMNSIICSHVPRLSPRAAIPLSLKTTWKEPILSNQDKCLDDVFLFLDLLSLLCTILSTNIDCTIVTLICLYWSLKSTLGTLLMPTKFHLQHFSSLFSKKKHLPFYFLSLPSFRPSSFDVRIISKIIVFLWMIFALIFLAHR